MTADVELLPCPFCGVSGAEVGGLVPWVQCEACDASGPQRESEADAISAWNTRAKDAEIEALRAEVTRRIEAFADRAEQLEARADRLAEALRELLIDMKQAQANMRAAARKDPRWEGCAEAIQPRVDAADAALRDHDQEGGNP